MSTQSSEYSWSIMSQIKRQSVRKCLFGRPDPEKLSEDLTRQDKIFSEAEMKFRDKWSYDPVTGPLQDGRYEYMTMDPLSDIPSFYTKGYSSFKSEPVRLTRDCTCYIGVLTRPTCAKRKLHLDNENDNENSRGNNENVDNLNECLLKSGESRFQSLSSEVTEVDDKMSTRLNNSSSVGLTLSESVFPELSPVSRNKDNTTPLSKPLPQVQSSMKDYLPSKKQRTNTKTLPRT